MIITPVCPNRRFVFLSLTDRFLSVRRSVASARETGPRALVFSCLFSSTDDFVNRNRWEVTNIGSIVATGPRAGADTAGRLPAVGRLRLLAAGQPDSGEQRRADVHAPAAPLVGASSTGAGSPSRRPTAPKLRSAAASVSAVLLCRPVLRVLQADGAAVPTASGRGAGSARHQRTG